MKRFTDTAKWEDPWFRRLSPQAKNLLGYLRDKCDSAGVVELDFDAISFHVGELINEKHLSELESRLQRLPNGKVLMPKFTIWQYGELSEDCPAHKPILKALDSHGLVRVGKEYRYPSDTLALPYEKSIGLSYPSTRVLDKEKEKDKEKDQESQATCQPTNGVVKLPPALVGNRVFVETWERWLGHLKQKRKPPTHHAQELQLKKLSNMGVEKATETLNHCIEKNWQGIYEPVNHTPKKPPQNQI